jgi:hypothetical protein
MMVLWWSFHDDGGNDGNDVAIYYQPQLFSSTGTPEDKLKLFFDMYDVTGEGKLDREAFKKMMK